MVEKNLNLKFSIVCKKSDKGLYKCLEVDLGYGVKKIFLRDRADYLELANITPAEFASMQEGDEIKLN